MARRDAENAIPRSDFRIAYNERTMIAMIAKFLAPLFVAGAAAAGIAFAPAAAAAPADCQESGQTSVCQRSGHTSIYVSPSDNQQGGGMGWPLGAGPVPPVFAMD
ncbi:MAG TPA: hypothetical protein PLE49_06790 [Mycobacterium sp.]|nr:hypothetical protein [Mycobacterium sp.]